MQDTKQVKVRKVYYAYYGTLVGGPHPMIRFGGKYLEALGFQIGDILEVQLEFQKIVIQNKSASHVVNSKPDT